MVPWAAAAPVMHPTPSHPAFVVVFPVMTVTMPFAAFLAAALLLASASALASPHHSLSMMPAHFLFVLHFTSSPSDNFGHNLSFHQDL